MGKKMKYLRFPFRIRSSSSHDTTTTWHIWPKTCVYPKTHSFRAPQDNIVKTMNCVYVHDLQDNNITSDHQSIHIEYGESFSTQDQALETTVIRGLTSQRLIFKSCPLRISDVDLGKTITQGKKEYFLLEGSLAMEMDSRDPFEDFRRSMEEMVDAHEMKGWDCLEKMLTCYLKVNSKSNHGYIVGAFVDLVVGIALDSCCGLLLPLQCCCCCSSSTTIAIADSLSSSPASFCSNILPRIDASSDLDSG